MQYKSKIILLVCVLILLVLLALLLIPDWTRPEDAVPGISESASVQVYASASPPASITVQNSISRYTVLVGGTADDPVYEIESFDESVPLNKSMLLALGNGAGSLTATAAIENPGGDLTAFGLHQPATAVVTFQDGGAVTLHIGAAAPDGASMYVQAEGDGVSGAPDTIYAAPMSAVSNYLLGAMDFIHPTLTQAVTSGALFDTATFGGALRETPVVVERVPPVSADTPNTYVVTSPVRRDIDDYFGVLNLQSLFGLISSGVVSIVDPDAPDEVTLARYGLQEPYSVVALTGTAEGDFTLSASAPDADGNVYVMRSGVPLIYRFAEGALSWLEAGVEDLADMTILYPTLNDLSEILLTTSGGTLTPAAYDFTLSGEDREMEVFLDGQALDLDVFRDFFFLLTEGALTAYTASGPDDPTPLLTVSLFYRDGAGSETVRFYKGPLRSCYVRFDNDDEYWLTTSTYVDRIIEDLGRLGES